MAALPRIPGHTVERLLATGAEAEVWLARDGDGDRVAVKVPASPGEAERLRRFAGDGIVGLRGVVGSSLVLDLAEGGCLAEHLARRTRLTPTEVVELGIPLARTLAGLHAAGAVHGDVKPANVLLTDDRPLLCDLGTAHHGTDGYRAAGLAGAAADVHALGVTLFELLAGALPDGEPLERVAPGTPPALVEVVERACGPTPPTAAELADQLATAVLTVAPRRDTRTFGPRPPRPAEAHEPDDRAHLRRLLPVAAAAVVAALLAGPLTAGGGAASAAGPTIVPTAPADWDGAVLTAPDGTRYTLGVTGGEVVLFDWDGDGTPTPAHYDPATGATVVFDGWAADGAPRPGERLQLRPGGHLVAAEAAGDHRPYAR